MDFGVYKSVWQIPVDVALTAVFGFLGYIFTKHDCELVPVLLGFILSPRMEENLRRAMLISQGDPSVFFTRPLSLVRLLIVFFLLILVVAPSVRKKREEAFRE